MPNGFSPSATGGGRSPARRSSAAPRTAPLAAAAKAVPTAWAGSCHCGGGDGSAENAEEAGGASWAGRAQGAGAAPPPATAQPGSPAGGPPREQAGGRACAFGWDLSRLGSATFFCIAIADS